MGQGFGAKKSDRKAYIRFLEKVLQATNCSNINPQIVYPLLKKNLDKLDDDFTDILRNWAKTKFSQELLSQVNDIATDIVNFSNLIQDFSSDDQAINLEIAITGYEVCSIVFTYKNSPKEWATIQNNLGNAYCKRIRGKREKNLEEAIHCYFNALKVRTRETYPEDWADTQNNLGNAYSVRIQKERAENLEIAISCFSAALNVYTSAVFPEKWAKIQNNLGETYRERIRGERAENLETAISYYLAALKVTTHEAFPEQWASIQNNLGNTYCIRIREERSDNLEMAIKYYLNALKEFTCKTFPTHWARIQNNLGNVYSIRIQGEREKNLELAIQYYLEALKVRTRQAFPEYWADTQNNLGNAYCERIQGKRIENLEEAISCYSNTLEVFTSQSSPEKWAMTQNNLGNAYYYRIEGEKPENLKVAINCYLAALKLRTREAFPQYYIETQFCLGIVYQDDRQLLKACNAFAVAVEVLESLRGEIISGNEAKQKLAEEWNKLYQRMVEVCLELGHFTEAIEYVERSKARNLVELILNRDLHNIFPPEIVPQIEQLRDEIASGQYQLQSASADNPTALAQHLHQLRQQRNELQDRYLPIGSGFKFDQFQKTLDNQTAIIEWYITSEGFHTFIFTRHSPQPLVLSASADDLNTLIDWANKYLNDYYQQKDEWRNQLESSLQHLAQILHIDDILCKIPDECTRLILIPHRYLHLFPLHALPSAKGDFLCDRFPNGVGYAPSCQLLQLTQTRKRPDFNNFFAIQNPTNDLLYTNLEVEIIRSSFSSTQVLANQAATKAAFNSSQDLPLAHCSHFSCHGKFNLVSPLESALIFANQEHLTLGEIFGLNLNQCRLVTLSACETGLTDPNSISDEYIGLPSAFLFAGSPSVVSSLWTVTDLSTAFLMIKFYENFTQSSQKTAGDVAIALNQAQKWLRNLTVEEFEEELNRLKPQLDRILTQLRPGQHRIFQESLKQIRERQPYPFANPYYWAAFTAVGF